MNIGGVLSLHHQAEILTTTGRSRASAVVSGDWRTDAARTAALASFGRDLGLAFQLADDALDLIADPEQTGKAVGTDIRQGIYSILVCALCAAVCRRPCSWWQESPRCRKAAP
jgi:geranylgeranyl pyrophosphate synthase